MFCSSKGQLAFFIEYHDSKFLVLISSNIQTFSTLLQVSYCPQISDYKHGQWHLTAERIYCFGSICKKGMPYDNRKGLLTVGIDFIGSKINIAFLKEFTL